MAKKIKAVDDAPQSDLGPRPRLIKLIVKNFRCIGREPVTIDLDDIVVLVGPNNTGKSSVLKAYEIIMSEGSKAGQLTIEDFPDGKVDPDALPEIELHTIVYDNSPGPEWIGQTDAGENIVKERWIWQQPGAAMRRGFNFTNDRWASESDKEKMPWGAANYANARRPQPHRVDAFESPENQAKEIVQLLMDAIKERVKTHQEESKKNEKSDYAILLTSIAGLQKKIVQESEEQINTVQRELTKAIERIFSDHQVLFDARPEDNVDKSLNLFKADPQLLMGPKDGYLSTIDRQGSGARRTLLWTAIRLLAESGNKKKDTDIQRPHVLLLDEPEICLHPNAIREACELLYNLPAATRNWQVMVTTHSPCFVDFSRDHTTIVRVERISGRGVVGTTIFRPDNARFTDDDKEQLKLLNMCDPYVAEFFFGGRTIIVEGDTEYTAFKLVASMSPEDFMDVHVVRARGKATIVLLAKIINQFGAPYAILHDSDRPTYIAKDGSERANPAWAHNITILETAAQSKASTRVVASITNFEAAYLEKEHGQEKPYRALSKIKTDDAVRETIRQLLNALLSFTEPLPKNAFEWRTIDELQNAIFTAQENRQSHWHG